MGIEETEKVQTKGIGNIIKNYIIVNCFNYIIVKKHREQRNNIEVCNGEMTNHLKTTNFSTETLKERRV
jgi:hypothetical protein